MRIFPSGLWGRAQDTARAVKRSVSREGENSTEARLCWYPESVCTAPRWSICECRKEGGENVGDGKEDRRCDSENQMGYGPIAAHGSRDMVLCVPSSANRPLKRAKSPLWNMPLSRYVRVCLLPSPPPPAMRGSHGLRSNESMACSSSDPSGQAELQLVHGRIPEIGWRIEVLEDQNVAAGSNLDGNGKIAKMLEPWKPGLGNTRSGDYPYARKRQSVRDHD